MADPDTRSQPRPVDVVRRTAEASPDGVALEIAGRRWTYAQLADASARLATQLVRELGGIPHRVGLLAAPSLVAYAGYLAVLSLGAAVVPISHRFPASRIREMCDIAQTDILLVGESVASGLGSPPAGVRSLVVGEDCDRLPEHSWAPADTSGAFGRHADDGLAYIIFTSGSTGTPKGVPISNRQLAAHIRFGVERYAMGPGSRVSQTFDLAFDPSVFCMMASWYSGATLVAAEPDDLLDPVRFVNASRLTHWFSVPSVISLSTRLRTLRPRSMPSLTWSMFAGEQLPLAQAANWAEAAENCLVDNLYGPTEMTITCTGYRLPKRHEQWPATSNGTVPIGAPYPHVEAALVTEQGNVSDHEGDLCLRGIQRFSGYLNPAENAGRFLRIAAGRGVDVDADSADPEHWYRSGDRVRLESGELVHVGRMDDQLKISGYRVEPGEIEALLRRCPGVDEAVVIARQRHGSMELGVVYRSERPLNGVLEATAQRELPPYMIPTRFVRVNALPTSHNGKLDRVRAAHLLDTGESASASGWKL